MAAAEGLPLSARVGTILVPCLTTGPGSPGRGRGTTPCTGHPTYTPARTHGLVGIQSPTRHSPGPTSHETCLRAQGSPWPGPAAWGDKLSRVDGHPEETQRPGNPPAIKLVSSQWETLGIFRELGQTGSHSSYSLHQNYSTRAKN